MPLPAPTLEVPRRCRIDRMMPAELAITEAMRAVEAMPADPCLTDAIVLLGKARDRVADFVDGVPAPSVSATVPAPTVGRFVQVNIGTDAEPAWRPAIVTAVWPHEFGGHPVTHVGLNVTVFPDGENDRLLLDRVIGLSVGPGYMTARHTSVPHEGIARTEQSQGVWCPTGPTWRWPPRDGA